MKVTARDDSSVSAPDTGKRPPTTGAARVAVCAAAARLRLVLAVLAARAASWGRRTGPRLARSTARSLQSLPAMFSAIALVVVLRSGPLARSGIGSPIWGQTAAELAERVLGWKLYLGAAALAGLGWLLGPTTLFGAVLVGPALVLAGFLAARTAYRHTVFARTRDRYGVDGWADFWELHRGLSARAIRVVAAHQRPSLTAEVPPVPDRRHAGQVAVATARVRRAALIERLPVSQCGTWLGRSAVGPWWGVQTYAAHRDVVGLIAPPQTGKTALMLHHIIDAVGAVVATSTKPEIYQLTAALRAAISGSAEVALFNPDNIGELGSTLRWCPVRGCAAYRFATTRAGLLVGARARKNDDDTRWDEWAGNALTGLLMVADLDGRTMTDVARWVHNPTDPTRGAAEALRLMRETHRRRIPEEVADALGQLLSLKAEKTRDSVFFAMRGAVAFMADPTIAWLCTPARDEEIFDVERFIDRRGALYLLGSEEQNTASAPLLAAFNGHIFATAKDLAARRGGRLDPPLTMILDEAALITPVPLPSWVADAGGRGIHIEWSVQTPSQLRERWGEPGAETIINATNALMVFGGLKAENDLNLASLWCGKRYELVPDPDGPEGAGRAKFDHVPVCPPHLVRVIPQWHALLVHRTTLATVIRMWPGWEREDVKRAGPPPTSSLPVVREPDHEPPRGRPGHTPTDGPAPPPEPSPREPAAAPPMPAPATGAVALPPARSDDVPSGGGSTPPGGDRQPAAAVPADARPADLPDEHVPDSRGRGEHPAEQPTGQPALPSTQARSVGGWSSWLPAPRLDQHDRSPASASTEDPA